MKVHGVFLVAVFFYLTHTQLVKGQFQPHEGCQTRCGEVEIKYPFGISSGCYYPRDDSFNITSCESSTAADGKCDGEGCCTTDISDELNNNLVEVGSTRLSNQTSSVHHFDPCVYSFLVEEGKFNFSSPEDLKNLWNGKRFPVVLDWSIGNKTCEEVGNKSICGGNSTCFTSNNRTGYICTCNDGYDGKKKKKPQSQDFFFCYC
ncbi:hypothetical protein F2Q70_00020261 [Brassica cretica]|uniref:EGF-like domain-containing protein n=1 Tax=Brassica cretica TaxID=69181 RepID=A0A8S9GVJ1_BRACR|nr:hypothetical protein F2Q70_00020261 [Brassica cretica]